MSTHANKARQSHRKTHKLQDRPPFDCIALLLQGGGALGAYQAGVYQALSEAQLYPDWVAGISIGAINSALIAGNSPESRLEKLHNFWDFVTTASPWSSAGQLAAGAQNGAARDPLAQATAIATTIQAMGLTFFSGKPSKTGVENLRQFWENIVANPF
jgi:NTE family protein